MAICGIIPLSHYPISHIINYSNISWDIPFNKPIEKIDAPQVAPIAVSWTWWVAPCIVPATWDLGWPGTWEETRHRFVAEKPDFLRHLYRNSMVFYRVMIFLWQFKLLWLEHNIYIYHYIYIYILYTIIYIYISLYSIYIYIYIIIIPDNIRQWYDGFIIVYYAVNIMVYNIDIFIRSVYLSYIPKSFSSKQWSTYTFFRLWL